MSQIGDEAAAVSVQGDYAFVAAFDDGLRVVDVSDPANPKEVGHCDTPGLAWGIFVSGSYAYVADEGSLCVIDVSDPANPYEAGYYVTPGNPHAVFISGPYAYVAARGYGLRVIDISDPSNPHEVGESDGTYSLWNLGVFVSGSYAYKAIAGHTAATLWSGLRVVDISNPSNPYEVGVYEATAGFFDVFVLGSYAYVAAADGLRVIDVSDPFHPHEVGYCYTPGKAQAVWVVGDYAYVAAYDAGLRIIDISNPNNPKEVTYHDALGYVNDVFVSGDYAYVASSDGLIILRLVTTTVPPTPTPITCSLPVDPQLTEGWERSKLGCPTAQSKVTWAAWQSFEGGYMLWRSDTDEVYILYLQDNKSTGRWKKTPPEWKWDGSNPDGVGMSPPPGLYEPKRGFGWLWRTHLAGPYGLLGWALEEEKGFCAIIQPFERGFVFRGGTVDSCLDELVNEPRTTHPDFAPLLFAMYEYHPRRDGTWRRY